MQPGHDATAPGSHSALVEHVRHAIGFLKALAHESRMLILCFLADGEKSVRDLEGLLGQRQSTVSQHLARLRLDGLVTTRRDGKMVYYSLADENVRTMLTALYQATAQSHG
jgi:DNA-binding transcriptional ArsR family regulator